MSNKKFIITKKVAKHGQQAVIIVPRMLESDLRPGTMIQLSIEIIKEADHGR